MKRTESKEEHYDFENTVKGHHIIPFLTLTSVIQTKSCFQEATDMSRAVPV